MNNLFEKVKQHKQQNSPFVIYSKPNSDKTVGLFQKDNELYTLDNFEAKGFVFAPFNDGFTCFLPKEFSEIVIVNNSFEDEISVIIKKSLEDEFTQKKQFEELVSKAIQNINLGLSEKIVVSRKETVEISSFAIETSFKKMLSLYPSAFKYCFYHPKIGLWIGATPEQLLKVNQLKVETVALAGTKLKESNLDWTPKEQQEQQFVTDYILESMKPYVAQTMVSVPYTYTAGIIQHIKTDISAQLKKVSNLKNIIEALHPTPAVCGFPKTTALDFILKNESYKREYYTGFLGELNYSFEVNKILESDLFVNLRCMQVNNTTAQLYIGCGITKDSNPEMEYFETKNKSETMKKII